MGSLLRAMAPALAILASASAMAEAGSVFDGSVADGGKPAVTMQFAKLKSKLSTGDKFGVSSGGYFCIGERPLTIGEKTESIFTAQATAGFRTEMAAAGYKIFQGEVSAFDSAPSQDPDYRLGGTVVAADFNLCYSGNDEKGKMHVEVKWELFSTKQQRVVHTQTTTGDYKADSFQNGQAGREFESRVFAAALKPLFASPEVRALMAGNAPAPAAMSLPPLVLKAARAPAGGAVKNTAALLSSVVTITSDLGTGSGFFVSDGYVLTNRHVVGASKYVKVKLSTGRELVGEVVRENAARDVALLKTEAGVAPALAVLAEKSAVGAEVYAVGSPLGQELAGTLTRGVVSGHREVEGASFVQSDVAVNPGNSGGPLLDSAGDAVAITAVKIKGAEGLAFFIPMKDALDKLAVQIQ